MWISKSSFLVFLKYNTHHGLFFINVLVMLTQWIIHSKWNIVNNFLSDLISSFPSQNLGTKSTIMQQVSTNSSVLITTVAGILNLDLCKYLQSLLQPVPHFIESLSFTDLNNWECQIYVNLRTASVCMKVLADFEVAYGTWCIDASQKTQRRSTRLIKCFNQFYQYTTNNTIWQEHLWAWSIS